MPDIVGLCADVPASAACLPCPAQAGKKGYCLGLRSVLREADFMPYAYLTDLDLAADFWTIRMVEVPADMRA